MVFKVVGAVLAGKSQKSAAKSAAKTATQVADTNNALARDIYGQNQAALAPFQQRGNEAGNAINALLGIGTGQPQAPPQPAQATMQGGYGGSPYGQMNLGSPYEPTPYSMGGDQGFDTNTGQPVPQTVNTAAPQPNALSQYQQAFQNYQNSTGYQFRLGEGMKGLNASYAARGVGNSGAAAKSALQYGQNIASGEFGNYLGQLANQQGVGLSGASAQAGVGQNYVNTVTGNNNNAGSAQANAALFRGQANANMYSGIAGSISNGINQFASSFAGGFGG